MARPKPDAGADSPPTMFNRGYLSLLITQFMGAANDNIVKMVVTNMLVAGGIWAALFAAEADRNAGPPAAVDAAVPAGPEVATAEASGGGAKAIPAICLTIPFILLSGYAGQLADRYSKRSIMLAVKIAEIPLAIIAFVGFLIQSFPLCLVALTMLGIQSSFFGPSKFGSIPELVHETRLSPANGLINMLSNLGVISGVLLAGFLSDLYHPTGGDGAAPGDALLWAPGVSVLLVAIAGLVSISMMPKLEARKPDLKFDWNPFGTYVSSLAEMGTGALFVVICAWSGFYMIGSMALLIIPEYKSVFEISYTASTMLLVMLSIAIAAGSVSAGLISGRAIRPALIPLGGLGMTVSFLLMGLLTPTYVGVSILLIMAGFSAGFYIVPLQALMQYLSPNDERGRFLGTANAMSFVAITFGAVLFFLSTDVVGMPDHRVNLVCGALALVGMLVGVWQMKRVLVGKESVVTPGQPVATSE